LLIWDSKFFSSENVLQIIDRVVSSFKVENVVGFIQRKIDFSKEETDFLMLLVQAN
jgi:hypothetical protein